MPAESLAALERRFYALATAGAEGVSEGISDGISEIDDDFIGRGPLPAGARLQIYRNMYWIRLLDTLAEQFPDLYEALGRAAFADVARGYLRAHPPTSPSLRELGQGLPAFLADRPELAEVAALEWTRIELFDGPDPDVTPLGADHVQSLDAEVLAELPLHLSETARVLAFAAGPVLVYREGGHVHHRVLDDAGEASALAEVARGTTLGLLCEQIGDAAVVFGYLNRWMRDEILRAPG